MKRIDTPDNWLEKAGYRPGDKSKCLWHTERSQYGRFDGGVEQALQPRRERTR